MHVLHCPHATQHHRSDAAVMTWLIKTVGAMVVTPELSGKLDALLPVVLKALQVISLGKAE